MDDAATSRVNGPYDTVSGMVAALDEGWSMLRFEFTAKFKKDCKRAKEQGRNMRALENALGMIRRGGG